jgi:hypothetical protein
VMGPKILNSSGGYRWLDVEGYLNSIDRESWELVSVVPVGWCTPGPSGDSVGQDVILFLRRPRSGHSIEHGLGGPIRSTRRTGREVEGPPGG